MTAHDEAVQLECVHHAQRRIREFLERQLVRRIVGLAVAGQIEGPDAVAGIVEQRCYAEKLVRRF